MTLRHLCTAFLGAITLPLFALPAAAGPYSLLDGRQVTALDSFQDCDVCPEMVVLPMGSFLFGASLEQTVDTPRLLNLKPGEQPGRPQEGPEHSVVIDVPIAMGRNEITREEWQACLDDNGCTHDPDPTIHKMDGHLIADEPRSPVMRVSFLDAQEYVAWLNARVGADVYRLPTEVEWEYAAQAGSNTKFAQGNALTREQANFTLYKRDDDRFISLPGQHTRPVPVDELDAANVWGLRHMSGNVRERTMSCRSKRHLGLTTSSAYLDAATRVASCRRVAKGGTWSAHVEYARPASRGSSPEDSRTSKTGFRIVR